MSSKRYSPRLGLSLLLSLFLLLTGLVSPMRAAAETLDANACAESQGVWVIVDDGQQVIAAGCAHDPKDGIDALTQIGVAVQQTNDNWQTICELSGVPEESCEKYNGFNSETGEFWSYWHRPTVDGEWAFSELMANNYVPPAGSVEGWRWGDGTAQPQWQAVAVESATDEAAPAPGDEPAAEKSSILVPTLVAVAILVVALIALGLRRRMTSQSAPDGPDPSDGARHAAE